MLEPYVPGKPQTVTTRAVLPPLFSACGRLKTEAYISFTEGVGWEDYVSSAPHQPLMHTSPIRPPISFFFSSKY